MEENSQIPMLPFQKQETISKPENFGRTHQTHSCVLGLNHGIAHAVA
jgi:hypothetical protein